MSGAIRNIVVVGGGTAGWMTAAALAQTVGTRRYSITLVESEQIGTVGVGEATIPMILLFNKVLGLDEDVFIRETNATFKLGIEFVDWRRLGHRYFHPFGLYGADMDGVGFQHFWLRWARESGDWRYDAFNAETLAAADGRFMRTAPTPNLPKINYAFQFDAALYAAFLRRYAEARGVVRVEGKIAGVERDGESGHVSRLVLDDGRAIGGDFFVDCSGFRGLLIEEALGAGYDDWSRWLPCNRAAAMPCERAGELTPYTRATAREAGWQWRIPLQHRTGNGYVFCDAFIGEDEAVRRLGEQLDGAAMADARILKFTAGRRRRSWIGNVLAIGLSSGFLEPLESTSIHLVQAAVAKLLTLFPKTGFDPFVVEKFNREMALEYEQVRDFIIAHYKVGERDDTPFWRWCRDMVPPDSLAQRLEVFRTRGEVLIDQKELFKETNWFAILAGQGLLPDDYHAVADTLSSEELSLRMGRIQAAINERVAGMPPHDVYLDKAGLLGAAARAARSVPA